MSVTQENGFIKSLILLLKIKLIGKKIFVSSSVFDDFRSHVSFEG